MRQKLFIVTQSLYFPTSCILCHQFHREKQIVCTACIALFQRLMRPCRICATPLADDSKALCGRCIKSPPFFDKACVAYTYEEPLRSLLHRFKYQEHLYLGHFLCQLILNALEPQAPTPQCLIPVPLHPKRTQSRGFNQAAILARLVAKKLKIPVSLNACKKTRNTPSQAHLDGLERQKNLKNVFVCEHLPYTHVAIIDDLLTTGATANEMAKTLKKSGIQQVDIWCCAKTT